MVASKKHSIWFLVLSFLKLTVGIALLIMCKFVSVIGPSVPPVESLWWTPGVPFIVTSAFGFVAAKTKQRGVIGLHMALNIVAMVVTGFLAMFAIHWSIFMPYRLSYNDFQESNKLLALMFGSSAMIILGWFLCLAGSIVTCSACCCCYTNISTPSVMYIQPGEYPLPVGAPPPPYMLPCAVEPEKDKSVKENYQYSKMP